MNFILYGPVALFLLGVVLPIAYNSLVKKRPLSETALTKRYWLASLLLGGAIGAVTYTGTLANIALPPFAELFPLAALALTVGLFEAAFFRGWIQLRFEKAFGAIPAIPIAAALYYIGNAYNSRLYLSRTILW